MRASKQCLNCRCRCRYYRLYSKIDGVVVASMASRGPEISYELRCCIIALRFFLPDQQNSFKRIADLLGLQKRAVALVFARARQRSGSNDLREILACVGTLERSGRPPRVLDGTPESAGLRALILRLDEYDLSEVAHYWRQLTGMQLSRSLVERVAHEHRDPQHDYDIVRGTRPLIPALSVFNMDQRNVFAQWIIQKIKEGAIFIFTDESAIEIGGPPRKKPRISRPKGQVDRFKRALPTKKINFKIMIWAAVCTNWEGDFPIYVWDEMIEDQTAKQMAAAALDQENLGRRQKVDHIRHCADSDPSSIEARTLRDLNSDIQRANQRRAAVGERGRLRRKTTSKVFPYNDLTRDQKKDGIDWYLYREKVCCLIAFDS